MSNKFIVNNIKILSSWGYNVSSNTDCTICRENLNTNSLYYQDKGIDSHVVEGSCGHSFHYECINSWVQTNKTCPICFIQWIYKSIPDECINTDNKPLKC